MWRPLVALALVAASQGARADGMSICSAVAHQLDTMLDHRGTLCIPGVTTDRRKGWTTFTLIAPQPVVGTPKARSAYAVFACAAFGKALNEDRRVRADELWISDTHLARQGQAYAMKVQPCQQLQPKVRAGTLSLEDMRATVEGALQQKTFTPP